jgi:hypothetical protein
MWTGCRKQGREHVTHFLTFNFPSPDCSQAPVLPACLACGCAGEGATQARRQELSTFNLLRGYNNDACHL